MPVVLLYGCQFCAKTGQPWVSDSLLNILKFIDTTTHQDAPAQGLPLIKSNTEIINAGKQRLAYLDFLDLASAVEEDEFCNITYTFTTPVATIQLHDSMLDGDVTVSVFVAGQSSALLHMELIGCQKICATDDKRGKYLEFLGQLAIGEYSRGSSRKEAGFRLYLEPFVRLEPYFKSGD